jgi:polynucleotide 5'-kinase involved in rRNA processing
MNNGTTGSSVISSTRFKKRPRSRNSYNNNNNDDGDDNYDADDNVDDGGWLSYSVSRENFPNGNTFTVRMATTSTYDTSSQNTEIVLRGCGSLSYEAPTSYNDEDNNNKPLSCLEVLGYSLKPDEILPYEVLPWESGIPITFLDPNMSLRIQIEEEEEKEENRQENEAEDPNGNRRMDHSTPYSKFLCSPSNPSARPTIIPNSWIDAVDQIIRRRGTEQQPQSSRRLCVAFAGGKNVGKSTCLKYCAHRLLSSSSQRHKQKVAILDADPGQPILSVPGILQLSVIETPLLATRIISSSTTSSEQQCRQHCVIRSLFFGSVSSSADPVLYLSQVRELLHISETLLDDDNGHIPVLVNLDGWIHGLGRQILSTMLGYITTTTTTACHYHQDSHVVVISGDSASKQLDLSPDVTDPTKLHTCWAFNSIHNRNEESYTPPPPQQELQQQQPCTSDSMQVVENDNGRGHRDDGVTNNDVDEVDDADDDNDDVVVEISAQKYPPPRQQPPPPQQQRVIATHSIPAATIRGVRLVSYFVPHLFTNTRLLNKSPGIDDPSCEIAMSLAAQLPYAVSIDAIPIRYPPEISTLPEDLRMDALNESIVGLLTETGNCQGLGLVRAIDRIHRILYILTPIPDISTVCTLAIATFHLPMEASFLGVQSESFRYQALDDKLDTILGATPMKSRNNIVRRSGIQNAR